MAILLLLAGCQSSGSVMGTAVGAVGTDTGPIAIDGLVSRNGRGVSGATVELYTLDQFITPSDKQEPAATTTSGDAGRFILKTPPGKYLLVARSTNGVSDGSGGGFAFFGRNPVRAHYNQRGVSLPLAPVHPVAVSSGVEAISGQILMDGAPVEGANVYVYLRADKGFRGPPYVKSMPTGPDGSFEIALEPGRYFLAARLRQGSRQTGPLVSGDLFGIHPSLPLALREGEHLTADFEVVKIPPQEKMSRYLTRFATLTGVVTDSGGTPAAGFRPCLYDNPRMLNEPLEVGEPTGPDGLFTLATTREGTFYLGARQRLGGPPRSGEMIGFAKSAPRTGFKLTQGDTTDGITILIRAVP